MTPQPYVNLFSAAAHYLTPPTAESTTPRWRLLLGHEPDALLEDRLQKPDWADNPTRYGLWKQSIANPDVLFELPRRFSCQECRCEEYRIECGAQVCSWCNGNGRRAGKV